MTARLRPILTALACSAVLVACGSSTPRTLPPPSSTAPTTPESTTTTIDLSVVSLGTVPGETTTTLDQFGDAVIGGTVFGPEGPVPGATVRLERLVGDSAQALEFLTDEFGAWLIQGLPGGRFRVRAWLAPTLGMTDPETFFLPDGDARSIDTTLRTFDRVDVLSGTRPSAPMIGDAVNLAVRITQQFVRADGVVVFDAVDNVPVRVESTGWRPVDEPVGLTDADGQVVFTFECDRVTEVTATAVVGADRQQFPLAVPSCRPLPTTTTTTTAPPSTTTTTTSDG